MAYTDLSTLPAHEYLYRIDFAKEPPSSYDLISDVDFEDGWGIWMDGGQNCMEIKKLFSTSAPSCVMLRNTGSTAVMFTNDLDLTSAQHLEVKFAVYHQSIETGEKFHVEVAPDGVNYETIRTYVSGTDFSGNGRLIETITHTANYSNKTIVRFRAETSANNDQLYFDDIELATSLNGSSYDLVDFNDFTDGWGIWIDGGTHCMMKTFPEPYSGNYCVGLRNGTETSSLESDTLELGGNTQCVTLDFTAYVKGLEAGEYLQLLLSTDNGETYHSVKQWNSPDLQNNTRIFESLPISLLNLNNKTKLKFQLFANENNDWVYFDDIQIKSRDKVAFFTTTVNTDQEDVLHPVKIVEAVAETETATITWSTTDMDAQYTSFDIERSEDGINYTKLNDEPFVFFGGEDSDMTTATYLDSIPSYDQTYIYRVCGKSSLDIQVLHLIQYM